MRTSGILMPVSSLPSPYGIGTLGKAAYRFVDFLKDAGVTRWQILPVGPTSFGDSPYQSFSCYAGNPYFIDLDMLAEQKLLLSAELDALVNPAAENSIDYGWLFLTREKVLRIAYKRFCEDIPRDFYDFCAKETWWVDDFAMFMTAKLQNGGGAFSDWPEDLRCRNGDTMGRFWSENQYDINFYKFCQYIFFKQWFALKRYANENGVFIIGDMPLYVSADSADVWAFPEMFLLDENRRPTVVAGCPPDYFSKTGQLWGNPIYDWKRHEQEGFWWWIRRIKTALSIFDCLRIDHFRGFDTYYAIPFGNKTAEDGKWCKGPGMRLFAGLQQEAQNLDIIAEDLGEMWDSVRELLSDTGFPGMKVIQFAFDCENSSDIPHNYLQNCASYTGTHDNTTLLDFVSSASAKKIKAMASYFNLQDPKPQDLHSAMLRAVLSSVAALAVIPLSDWLCYGSEARINTPSSLGGGNWCFRVSKNVFTKKMAAQIKAINLVYCR